MLLISTVNTPDFMEPETTCLKQEYCGRVLILWYQCMRVVGVKSGATYAMCLSHSHTATLMFSSLYRIYMLYTKDHHDTDDSDA